ncbi:MAG: glycosyltransferase, partial [Bacteroidota bacterium]
MKKQQKIWIAIPALNEAEWLPATIDAVRDQDYQNYEIVVCVNQPDEFSSSDKSEEKDIFDNNRLTLEYLQKQEDIPLHILDKSSLDKGWKDGKGSVGAARKYLMDYIAEQGNAEDIILSMDADTLFG